MQNYQSKSKFSFLNFTGALWHAVTFALLIMLYVTANGIITISNWKLFPKGVKARLTSPLLSFYVKATKLLDQHRSNTISRVDLIELSVRNMKSKKTRTIVTIGGMMIGIGAIVFLVSIGYGLQQLVITRVARLEEMRQADITTQSGGKIKIDDKTLSNFKDISAINMALPLIAVVGRVNYQNSQSDMAVYGVTTDYLQQSAIKPVEGKIFDSNELTAELLEKTGQVAGATTENRIGKQGESIQKLDYAVDASSWIRVRENPSTTAKVLGYTKRVEGTSAGEEVWGDSYLSDYGAGEFGNTEEGSSLGKWIKAPVLLWKEEKCDSETQGDCEEGKYVVLRDEDNKQVQKTGFFAEINIKISGVNVTEPQVLGVTTNNSTASGKKVDDMVGWVEIASEAGVIATPETKTIELAAEARKQAVVNRAMLSVLGIKESEAVGKKFTASFVVVGDLLTDPTQKIESAPAEYTIIGVTPEEKTPVFYVPFIDLRTLGITNYSQVKVVVNNQTDLPKVRKQVEAMGYVTRSVADTVEQINSLFATARTLLMLLGMVALSVAALGMFNTLTVSLLERTREVGLMKAMGMKSSEVQELFLTESMIMGFFGGILGIILGFILGKFAGIVISIFSIFKGIGFVDISYLPLSFVFVIIFLSLLVGIITGIYPARRATKISALNALRYE
ncbi:MAG: FtsX-like permease family protein [Candidatus Shapirobacteria bacterium]|jgi:ABC-type antimicrobial peptide transport system permease subunit